MNGRSPSPIAAETPLVFPTADERDAASLEEACRSNGWLKRGGYAWQDDPSIGERPFAFCRASDMEGLGAYLRQCPRPLRQGIVYRDLALIQQADFGDDWWALRRDGDGWAGIGSIPASQMALGNEEDLKAFVESALGTDPAGLAGGERFQPERIAGPLCAVSLEYAAYEVMDEYDDYGEFRESVERAVAERPDLVCDFLDEIAEETGDVTASSLSQDIRRMDCGIAASLADRARAATGASEHMGRDIAHAPSRSLDER